MELHIAEYIDEVPRAVWNALEGSDHPFLRHEFLAALEHHGAVGEATGWFPRHLLLWDGDTLLAAAPAYLKTHSWGEFVFDFAWADAYARNGLDYYPKLVIAVPWSPVTGHRILVGPDCDPATARQSLLDGARAYAEQAGASSTHWLFISADEAETAMAAGYELRLGCQYHWHNHGYADFETFLGALTAKKRKNIRRERRRVRESGISLRAVHGDEADTALWAAMHRFYRHTFHVRGNIPVLSRECLQELGRRLGDRVVLMIAERDDRVIAGAICLRDDSTLYGRYWGCDEEVDALHFETCYYQGIEYCIREGLQRFEPGAQGEHKVARGFQPVLTRSVHHMREPAFHRAVQDFLRRERRAVEAYADSLTMDGPYRENRAGRP